MGGKKYSQDKCSPSLPVLIERVYLAPFTDLCTNCEAPATKQSIYLDVYGWNLSIFSPNLDFSGDVGSNLAMGIVDS